MVIHLPSNEDKTVYRPTELENGTMSRAIRL